MAVALSFSIYVSADTAYRLCVCSWGFSHFSPLASFIPQSSLAALVYSNQELAEQCQKAFHSGIWNLLSFGCTVEPRVPTLIPPQPNNNSAVCVHSHGRKHHISLLAYCNPDPQELSVTQLLFPAVTERGNRDQTKARRSIWALLKSVSLFALLFSVSWDAS